MTDPDDVAGRADQAPGMPTAGRRPLIGVPPASADPPASAAASGEHAEEEPPVMLTPRSPRGGTPVAPDPSTEEAAPTVPGPGSVPAGSPGEEPVPRAGFGGPLPAVAPPAEAGSAAAVRPRSLFDSAPAAPARSAGDADGVLAGLEDDEPTVPMSGRGLRAGGGPMAGSVWEGALPVPPGGSSGVDPQPTGSARRGRADADAAVGSTAGQGVSRTGDGEPDLGEISATSPDPSISGTSDRAANAGDPVRRALRRPAPAGTLIWVLLALLGFTLVVQLRSNDADDGLATSRQEDLVRILSDLEAQDSRLLSEIQGLESSKQQLNSGVAGREAALAEAARRSQELGLLAGTVPGRGPGLDITLREVGAADVLNAVQELRGAGGEVMQLNGANGAAVRVVASSFFVDASGGGIIADGERLTGPLRLLVIGPPGTMSTALQIPGGVVASAKSDGGSVTMDSRSSVDVTAVRKAAALRYARPVS